MDIVWIIIAVLASVLIVVVVFRASVKDKDIKSMPPPYEYREFPPRKKRDGKHRKPPENGNGNGNSHA